MQPVTLTFLTPTIGQPLYRPLLGFPVAAGFPHDAYLAELAGLRDRLKIGLSQTAPEPGGEALPVPELAGRIKALKDAHTIEAPPERATSRRIDAEEPVTARIRRRGIIEAPAQPAPEVSVAELSVTEPLARPDEPRQAAIDAPPKASVTMAPRPHADHRQQVAFGRRLKERQPSLF